MYLLCKKPDLDPYKNLPIADDSDTNTKWNTPLPIKERWQLINDENRSENVL